MLNSDSDIGRRGAAGRDGVGTARAVRCGRVQRGATDAFGPGRDRIVFRSGVVFRRHENVRVGLAVRYGIHVRITHRLHVAYIGVTRDGSWNMPQVCEAVRKLGRGRTYKAHRVVREMNSQAISSSEATGPRRVVIESDPVLLQSEWFLVVLTVSLDCGLQAGKDFLPRRAGVLKHSANESQAVSSSLLQHLVLEGRCVRQCNACRAHATDFCLTRSFASRRARCVSDPAAPTSRIGPSDLHGA